MLGINNYSFLFNNSSKNGSNSLESTFNFTDFAAIKNGSYKKLAKAQFADEKKNSSSNSVNKVTPIKSSSAVQSSTKIRKSVDSLKNSVKALDDDALWKQEGGQYNTDKIAGAVKDFVSKYNNVVDEVDASKLSTVNQSAKWMNSLTNTMKSSLEKVGITVGEDNKLTVNDDTLKGADIKAVKAMFKGDYSYASQTSDKASSVASASLRDGSMYTNTGSYASLMNSWFNASI